MKIMRFNPGNFFMQLKFKCGPCNHPKRKTSHIPKKKMGLLLAHSLGKVYLWHVIRQKKCVK